MKKIALYTFLSFSSVLIAQDVIKYEIEPTISYNSFDSSSKMESTFMYGIRGTIYQNSYYGYRLSYERADDVHYDNTSTKKTTDLQRISGQIIVNGEEEYNVIPYILLGGGYEILSNETTHDVSQGYVEGGIGFKYHMNNDLIFDLETRALKKFDTDDIDYLVSFGLGYLFDPTIVKPKVYQPGILEELPKVKNKVLLTPEIDTKELIQPIVVADDISATYTFNEEQDQNIPETIAPIISTPEIIQHEQFIEKQYYVQMAACFKKHDNKLINKLEGKGYQLYIKDAIRHEKDTQLILVGPFESSKSAKRSLRDLKKIKKDAFITKI